jgi:hypothetical protein
MCWQLRSGATARHLRACNCRFKHYDASRLLGGARFEQANAPARTDAEDKRSDADNRKNQRNEHGEHDKAFQDRFLLDARRSVISSRSRAAGQSIRRDHATRRANSSGSTAPPESTATKSY